MLYDVYLIRKGLDKEKVATCIDRDALLQLVWDMEPHRAYSAYALRDDDPEMPVYDHTEFFISYFFYQIDNEIRDTEKVLKYWVSPHHEISPAFGNNTYPTRIFDEEWVAAHKPPRKRRHKTRKSPPVLYHNDELEQTIRNTSPLVCCEAFAGRQQS